MEHIPSQRVCRDLDLQEASSSDNEAAFQVFLMFVREPLLTNDKNICTCIRVEHDLLNDREHHKIISKPLRRRCKFNQRKWRCELRPAKSFQIQNIIRIVVSSKVLHTHKSCAEEFRMDNGKQTIHVLPQ